MTHASPPLLDRLAVLFFALQGVATLAFWAAVFASTSVRAHFVVPGAADATLLAFAPADIVLLGGGSLVSAYGLARRRPWVWAVVCANAAVAVYASSYVLVEALFANGPWLAAVSMGPSLVVPSYFARRLRPRRDAPEK